jgi:hypothetical protein
MRSHSQTPVLHSPLPPALQSELVAQPQVLLPQAKPDGHASPHAPQELALAETLVSQPLSAAGATGREQSPKPRSQLGEQLPPLHESEATPAVEHARLHAPQ